MADVVIVVLVGGGAGGRAILSCKGGMVMRTIVDAEREK